MIGNLLRGLLGVCLASGMASALALNIELSNVSGTTKANCTYNTVNFSNNGAIKVTCSDDVKCPGCGGTTLLPQTIVFGTVPNVAVGGTGKVSATASSNLQVTFSNTTPTICTIQDATTQNQITVKGDAEGGLCVIAADQAGNGSYSSAIQATQSFSISSGGTSTNCPSMPSDSKVVSTGEIGTLGFTGVFNVPGMTNGYSVVAIKFHLTQTSGAGGFTFDDATGLGSKREMIVALSACPGDFTGVGVIQGTFNGGYCIATNSVDYAVSTVQTKYCSVRPGQPQYYLNVKTTNPGLDYRFQLQQTLPQ